MEIKEVKPINFLFFRTDTRINELANFLPVAKALYREAVTNDLTVTGPIHWHYIGFDGNSTTQFTLEIALPVAEVNPDYDGEFHFKRTDNFRCVSTVHEGNWETIPEAYKSLLRFVDHEKLTPISMNREVYVNSDFENPEANVTEIQLGVR